MELKLNEVEVQKLNLQPGEVLVVKVKSNDLYAEDLEALSTGLKSIFFNNKVVVLSVEADGNIDLTAVKESEYTKTGCENCSCNQTQTGDI